MQSETLLLRVRFFAMCTLVLFLVLVREHMCRQMSLAGKPPLTFIVGADEILSSFLPRFHAILLTITQDIIRICHLYGA